MAFFTSWVSNELKNKTKQKRKLNIIETKNMFTYNQSSSKFENTSFFSDKDNSEIIHLLNDKDISFRQLTNL